MLLLPTRLPRDIQIGFSDRALTGWDAFAINVEEGVEYRSCGLFPIVIRQAHGKFQLNDSAEQSHAFDVRQQDSLLQDFTHDVGFDICHCQLQCCVQKPSGNFLQRLLQTEQALILYSAGLLKQLINEVLALFFFGIRATRAWRGPIRIAR